MIHEFCVSHGSEITAEAETLETKKGKIIASLNGFLTNLLVLLPTKLLTGTPSFKETITKQGICTTAIV